MSGYMNLNTITVIQGALFYYHFVIYHPQIFLKTTLHKITYFLDTHVYVSALKLRHNTSNYAAS